MIGITIKTQSLMARAESYGQTTIAVGQAVRPPLVARILIRAIAKIVVDTSLDAVLSVAVLPVATLTVDPVSVSVIAASNSQFPADIVLQVVQRTDHLIDQPTSRASIAVEMSAAPVAAMANMVFDFPH